MINIKTIDHFQSHLFWRRNDMAVMTQFIVNGIIAGSTYALVAIGLTMVYGILHFINFSHGELVMLGAYITFALMLVGLSLYLAIFIAIVLVVLVGMTVDAAVFKPLRNTKADSLSLLLASIGVSIVIQSIAQLLWGRDIRVIDLPPATPIAILGAFITPVQIVMVVIAGTTMVLLFAFLNMTHIGTALRATSDNEEMAQVVGINNDRVIAVLWIISSECAAIGGVLIGINTNLQIGMGLIILIKALAAIIMGSIGNIRGALIGGMVIGFAENLALIAIPSQYKDAVAFTIMILLLLFKPEGIFGSKERMG
jgi:branched-subunit amino acid ABC-type transport system permease component